MPLARQLSHQRCVRPGPLVLGTALLKSPTPAEDRDRTVSRMLVPHCWGHRLYLHPVSRGRRVMGSIDSPSMAEDPISSLSNEEVVTGAEKPLPRRCRSTSAADIRFVFEWFRAAKASTSRANLRNSSSPSRGAICGSNHSARSTCLRLKTMYGFNE